jgi:hypothetical protein
VNGATEPRTQPRLLFVYNADGRVASLLLDAVHKAVSPRTYGCHLCQLTYGYVRPRPQWTAFVESLRVPVRFLHRDEFRAEFRSRAEDALPAAYLEAEPRRLDPLVSAAEMNATQDLQQLQTLVLAKIDEMGL